MTSKPSPEEINALREAAERGKSLIAERRAARPAHERHSREMHFLVAQRINAARERQGLTMKAFAERIGVDQAQLSRWLGGRQNLTLNSIARMHIALGEPIVMIDDQSYKSFERRGLSGTPASWHEEDSEDGFVLFHQDRQRDRNTLVRWDVSAVQPVVVAEDSEAASSALAETVG